MGLNSNVSETLAIFQRALEQGDTTGYKMRKQCLKNKAHFPLRHPENIILTEPQPKKAKLLCCIRKAKLFYLMLDEDSNNVLPSASSIRDLGTRLPILKGFLWKNY